MDWPDTGRALRFEPRASGRRAGDAVLAAAFVVLLGVLSTAVIVLFPPARFAYRSLPAHVALESVESCIAWLLVLLLANRVTRIGLVRDLLLFDAFLLLAAAGLVFVAVPLAVGQQVSPLTTWAPLIVRLLGAALVAAAAAAGERRLSQHARLRVHAAAAACVLATVLAATELLRGVLPRAFDPRLVPELSGRPAVTAAHPLVLAAQSLGLVLFAYAAVRFARDVTGASDALLGWLASGSALAACSRLDYLLFPSIVTEWVYVGDLLRAGFYALLLAGAIAEIHRYSSAYADAVVLAERRRLARELHDGVIQEVGYIRAQARLVADPELSARLVSAADRASGEARDALFTLTRDRATPLSELLTHAATDVAERYGVPLRVTVAHPPAADDALADSLVRIVREAVGNAVRHADATLVELRMSRHALLVHDDGRGFDPHGRYTGFGLVSMRERAAAAGLVLEVRSAPGTGSDVTVSW